MDPLTIKLLVSVLALGVIVLMYAVWDSGRLLHAIQKDLEKYPDDGPAYWEHDGRIYLRQPKQRRT